MVSSYKVSAEAVDFAEAPPIDSTRLRHDDRARKVSRRERATSDRRERLSAGIDGRDSAAAIICHKGEGQPHPWSLFNA
jgi:hypothetical protein